MDAIFAIALQKLVQWTLDNVHWKTFNRPIWFSGRWFLSSWYFQFTLRYSPLSLWYFQYWKSIWKQHDNDCLPLLKWDVKPLSHCCLSCLRSFNQFSEFHQKAKLETRPCCLMFLRSASVVVTIARWHLRHRAAAESLDFKANRGEEGVVSWWAVVSRPTIRSFIYNWISNPDLKEI